MTLHTLSLKSWALNLSVSLAQFTSKDRKSLPIFYAACSPGFLLLHFSQLFCIFSSQYTHELLATIKKYLNTSEYV